MHCASDILIQIDKLIVDSIAEIEALKDSEKSKSQKFIFDLWIKFVKNNEAILSLLKNGFIDEAFSIHRLSIEHLFNIFALARDDDFINVFINNSEKSNAVAANSLHKDLEKDVDDPLSSENREAINKLVENNKLTPLADLGYSIFNAAQKSELAPFYNDTYRVLSISHAHSTFISLICKIGEDDVRAMLENTRDFLNMILFLRKEVFKSRTST